jgi:hypothetical protein
MITAMFELRRDAPSLGSFGVLAWSLAMLFAVWQAVAVIYEKAEGGRDARSQGPALHDRSFAVADRLPRRGDRRSEPVAAAARAGEDLDSAGGVVLYAICFCFVGIQRLVKGRERTVPHWLKVDYNVMEWGIGGNVSHYEVQDIAELSYADGEFRTEMTFVIRDEDKELPKALMYMLSRRDLRLLADALWAANRAIRIHGVPDWFPGDATARQ